MQARDLTQDSPQSSTSPPVPNPFFGKVVLKKAPVHVKDDFNPFKFNKVAEASAVSAYQTLVLPSPVIAYCSGQTPIGHTRANDTCSCSRRYSNLRHNNHHIWSPLGHHQCRRPRMRKIHRFLGDTCTHIHPMGIPDRSVILTGPTRNDPNDMPGSL
jgi:hypothetical protein